MSGFTATCRALWTSIDPGRNTTLCDWLFGFGWLLFGLAVYAQPNPALSVGLFTWSGWLITSGCIVQRAQARLWPFDGSLMRGIRHLTATIHKAEVRAERFARALGMFSLLFFSVSMIAGLIFAH